MTRIMMLPAVGRYALVRAEVWPDLGAMQAPALDQRARRDARSAPLDAQAFVAFEDGDAILTEHQDGHRGDHERDVSSPHPGLAVRGDVLPALDPQGTDAFSACIARSPRGARSSVPGNAWSVIRKPVFLLAGTRDTERGGVSWETRTEPFRNMPSGCKWLGIIDGSSHLNFAGNGMSRMTEVRVSMTIGNFLNSLLRGDCSFPAEVRGMKLMTK